MLRPDLFDAETQPVDEVDAARAQEYALLATLLARAPDCRALGRLARLRGDPSPLGHGARRARRGRGATRRGARGARVLRPVRRRGARRAAALCVLLPHRLSLRAPAGAAARATSSAFGIERAEGQSEPEDSAAILCEIMAGLAGGTLRAPPGAEREIFETHIAPWMGRFFADLAISQAADFYARVGALGQTFLEIEAEAFKLPR